jgi:glutamyl-tRNA reductase
MPNPEIARQAELERAIRRLSRGEPLAEVIDLLSQRLTNKLLHTPLQALNGGLRQK